MTNEIKIYKKLTTIKLFDWEIVTPMELNDLENLLHSNSTFLRIGDEVIAKNQIKRIFIRKVNDIEWLIYSLDSEDRKLVQQRLKEMAERSWTTMDKIDFKRMQNIISEVLNNK